MTAAADIPELFGADRALALCAAAVAAGGADGIEARLTARSGEYTRFAGDRIHQAQEISEWALDIRAVVHGPAGVHAAHASTGDPAAVQATVARAAAAARAQAAAGLPGTARPVAGHEVAEHQWATDSGPVAPEILRPPSTADYDLSTRSGLAQVAIASATAAGGWAAGMLGRAVTELAVATSAGTARYTSAWEASGSLTVNVGGGSSHWVDLDRDAATLAVEQAITTTVSEAVLSPSPAVLPSGVYDVVLGPLAAGELVEALSSFGFTAADVADGVGAVARRRGEQVAAPTITVLDDALAARGLPIGFDMEGTTKQAVTFLRNGVVTDAVGDLASAARAGAAGSTGHAHVGREQSPAPTPANIHLVPGTSSAAELIAGVRRGVYVQRLWYTRVVDRVATTLTGVSRDACFAIVDGRIAGPVAGARFTESVFGVLSRVDGVGSQVLSQPLMNIFNGAVTAPAIRVRGFRFGPAEGAR